MKYSILTTLLLVIIFSCNKNEKIHLQNLMSRNYGLFMGLSIEARKKDNNKFVAYKFSREFKNQRYSLPNFKYYSETQIKNPLLFDVMKYAAANDIVSEKNALTFVKSYSDSVMTEYERLGVYKIFSSYKQGDFIVFFLNEKEFLAYIPDTSRIYSDFWKNKLRVSKSIERNWVIGNY